MYITLFVTPTKITFLFDSGKRVLQLTNIKFLNDKPFTAFVKEKVFDGAAWVRISGQFRHLSQWLFFIKPFNLFQLP